MLPAFSFTSPVYSSITFSGFCASSVYPAGSCRLLSPCQSRARGTKRCSVVMKTESEPSSPKDIPQTPMRSPLFHVTAWCRNALAKRKDLKADVLRNYGIAALLSYGFFDALTYSVSFLISLRAYLAAGKVLTWKTLPQVRYTVLDTHAFSP